MSIAHKHSEMDRDPIHLKIHKIIENLEKLLSNLSKHKDCPTLQNEVEECAKQIMSLITEKNPRTIKLESFLKNAVIDLTEVPQMQPQMQKIAFEVSIRAAVKNLQSFLSGSI